MAQKSRTKWIAEGDSNIRFFHACMRSKRRRTRLLKVKVDAEWIEDVQRIKRAVKDHFEAGYKEVEASRLKLDGVYFNQVSSADNEYLVDPFLMDEIREVVWECDGNKSPGPYGFNLNFFKSFWEVISPGVINFFDDFHKLARIPKAISASFIALIPKNNNPQSPHLLKFYGST